MKLIEEIEKERKNTLKETENYLDVFEHTTKLLTEFESTERDILKEMGIDTQLKVVENKTSDLIERKQLEELKGNLYTEDEIKNLCIKYNLKFLRSTHYKGSLPADLASIIRRMLEKEEIHKSDLNYKFYVLAPPKMFQLSKMETIDKDPVLFLKITHNNVEYFKPIKSWGNDFSPMRRILGFLFKDITFTSRIMIISLFLMLISILTIFAIAANKQEIKLLLYAIIPTIFLIIDLIGLNNISECSSYAFSEDGWDHPSKYYCNI